MRHYCTYFDHNYVTRGIALYQSLSVHQSGPFTLWVLALSTQCKQLLETMKLPNIRVISLEQFEADDEPLRAAKSNRSVIEYYFTCTPSILIYILKNHSEIENISYLDGDMYFFGPAEEMYQDIGESSVAITPHRFPPALKGLEIYGLYNVGLVYFRRDTDGMSCLQWWRDRCLEWCFDRLEGDRFADQKYLDSWSTTFSNVRSIAHLGINLAPWNVGGHKLTISEGRIYVDNQRLLLYHFHGLKQLTRHIYDPRLNDYLFAPDSILRQGIYHPYLRVLKDLAQKLNIKSPVAPRSTARESGSLELRRRIKSSLISNSYLTSRAETVYDLGVVLYISNDISLLDPYLNSFYDWGGEVKELVVMIGCTETIQAEAAQKIIESYKVRVASPPRILLKPMDNSQAWNEGVRQLQTKYCYLSTPNDQITKGGVRNLIKAAERLNADVIYSTFALNESFLRRNFTPSPLPEISANEHTKSALLTAFNLATQKPAVNLPNRLYRTAALRKLPFPERPDRQDFSWSLYSHIHETILTLRCFYLHNPEAPEASTWRTEQDELKNMKQTFSPLKDQLDQLFYNLMERWEMLKSKQKPKLNPLETLLWEKLKWQLIWKNVKWEDIWEKVKWKKLKEKIKEALTLAPFEGRCIKTLRQMIKKH